MNNRITTIPQRHFSIVKRALLLLLPRLHPDGRKTEKFLFTLEDRMESQYGTTASRSRAYTTAEPQSRSNTHPRQSTNTAGMTKRSANSKFDISDSKEFKLQQLAMLSITPIVRSIHHWWLQRAERHYLICADVEQQRAREAQMNVAYYQKRAALARSARN